MIQTKFYNIDNEALLFATLSKNSIDYVGPRRRRRSWMAKMAPWAIAFIVGVGYSAFKLAGA